MPDKRFAHADHAAVAAVKNTKRVIRRQGIGYVVTGICAVCAFAIAAGDVFAMPQSLPPGRAPLVVSAAGLQLAGGSAGAAKVGKGPVAPPRGSSAALNGGSSADKGDGAHRDAKKSPKERAEERSDQRSEAEAAKRAKEDAKGGQAFPTPEQ